MFNYWNVYEFSYSQRKYFHSHYARRERKKISTIFQWESFFNENNRLCVYRNCVVNNILQSSAVWKVKNISRCKVLKTMITARIINKSISSAVVENLMGRLNKSSNIVLLYLFYFRRRLKDVWEESASKNVARDQCKFPRDPKRPPAR